MITKDIIIEGKIIGKNYPVFLIAEAGVNHNGSLNLAKKIIDEAAEAKVDAIKFQTFITEDLILKEIPKVEYQKSKSTDDEDFFHMIKKYELSQKEFQEIKTYCSKKKIIFLSTPFDRISVEWLEELDIPAYKVGSGDITNFPLLKLICSKKKPIFLSTGMASMEEVKQTVDYIKKNGIEDLIIFQCTTNYPASLEEINLNVIDSFKREFPNILLGFSDHSLGIEASIGAVTKGVKVIEKHITLDKSMEGPDHKASLNPKEMRQWIISIRNIEKALGSYEKNPSRNELEIAKIARKSIVSARDINKGDILTSENITTKRPGMGIPPIEYFTIIKKKVKAKRFIPINTLINRDDLEY